MLKNLLSITGLRILSTALGAAFFILVAKGVPASTLGQYVLLFSVAQMVGSSSVSWCNLALLRFAREEFNTSGRIRETLGTRLSLHVVILGPIAAVAILGWPTIMQWSGLPADSLPYFIAAMLIVPTAELFGTAAQSVGKFAGYGGGPVLVRIAQIAAVCAILAGTQASWTVLMVGSLAGYALSIGYTLFWVFHSGQLDIRFATSALKRMLGYGSPLIVAGICGIAINWVGIWQIKYYLGIEQAGVYAWAYNLSLIVTALLSPLSVVLMPKLIDIRLARNHADNHRFRAIALSLLSLAAALMPIPVGLVIFAGPWINLGPYQSAIPVFAILVSGIVFQLGIALFEPAVFANETRVIQGTLSMVLMVAISAGLGAAVIPAFGMRGGALALVAGLACGLAVQIYAFSGTLARQDTVGTVMPFLLSLISVVLAVYSQNVSPGLLLTGSVITAVVLLLTSRQAGQFRALTGIESTISQLSPAYAGPANNVIFWLAKLNKRSEF